MVEYPVRPESVRRRYRELADDVRDRERRIRGDLPVETTAGIHAHLRGVVTDWETGRKSLRTVPVCNAVARQVGRSPGDDLTAVLTALDASVNVLDDVIDTRELSPRTRVALTANAAFSAAFLAENCPPDSRAAVGSRLREYFTALFQIPLVERELFAEMTDASEADSRTRAAERIYAYRARDIDAFVRIATLLSDVDADCGRRLLGDLRAYRARRLLFKDIADVERDLADGDVTPVVHLLDRHDSAEAVADSVEELYGRFPYSDAGAERYGDVLAELEDPPTDLRSAVREAGDHLAAADI
ncbi:MAG: hypothetical protein ABEJ26_05920 [Halosimplex sp.]